MYLRTILILIVLGALTLFTVANWHAFTTPTTLSLIVGTVEAPIGLMLLGATAVLTALFLIYVVYLQSSVLLETRRHERELYGHRSLAEHAESSRIQDLRASLETKLDELARRNDAEITKVLARLDQMDAELRRSIEASQNSLAAAMAEIDDRLANGLGESYPRRRASSSI
jgi:uncharacterized integral membrane protein